MRSWSEAWQEALYGSSGFFVREVPAHHFRTNVAVPLFAHAVRRLAGLVDDALGRPDPFDVVDLGAGRGELLAALPDVPSRWRLTGVDVAAADVPFRWLGEVPALTGLLIANEYLDSVPLDVLEDGRLVLVSDDGGEQLGAPLRSEWAEQWWPGEVSPTEGVTRSRHALRDVATRSAAGSAPAARAGRVEVGASRDLAWAAAVAKVERGLAVAVDYGHTRADRRPTLTGYRAGRQVPPVPDGSRDLTAHVALDAVAAATGSLLVTQRAALQSLGIAATLPEPTSPSYTEELERASQARELLDPAGLGGFGWLLRSVGVEVGWMGA